MQKIIITSLLLITMSLQQVPAVQCISTNIDPRVKGVMPEDDSFFVSEDDSFFVSEDDGGARRAVPVNEESGSHDSGRQSPVLLMAES